jgi:hypothetical protein
MFTKVIDSLESSIDSTIVSFSFIFSKKHLGEGFEGRADGVLNIAILFSFLLEVLSKFSFSLAKNIKN